MINYWRYFILSYISQGGREKYSNYLVVLRKFTDCGSTLYRTRVLIRCHEFGSFCNFQLFIVPDSDRLKPVQSFDGLTAARKNHFSLTLWSLLLHLFRLGKAEILLFKDLRYQTLKTRLKSLQVHASVRQIFGFFIIITGFPPYQLGFYHQLNFFS